MFSLLPTPIAIALFSLYYLRKLLPSTFCPSKLPYIVALVVFLKWQFLLFLSIIKILFWFMIWFRNSLISWLSTQETNDLSSPYPPTTPSTTTPQALTDSWFWTFFHHSHYSLCLDITQIFFKILHLSPLGILWQLFFLILGELSFLCEPKPTVLNDHTVFKIFWLYKKRSGLVFLSLAQA